MLSTGEKLSRSVRSGRALWVWLVAALALVLLISALASHPQTSSYTSGSIDAISEKVGLSRPHDVDYFQNFVKAPGCDVKTQEIYHAGTPYCKTKEELLEAMHGGGRLGFDRPYNTLDCSMRWYTTAEICNILSRFNRIFFIGDSLMRQLMITFHIYMREDMYAGARQTWHEGNPEEQDCHCRTLYDKGSKCFWWEAIDTDDVYKWDPASVKCNADVGRFSFSMMPYWPIKDDDIKFFKRIVSEKFGNDPKRVAVVMGQGPWNAYNATESMSWTEQVETAFTEVEPSFPSLKKLFIMPASTGWRKPLLFAWKGNNILVVNHANTFRPWVQQRGYDSFGLFNVTLQADSPDGTHANLETCLVEAMMVFNWLDMISK